MEHNGKTYPEWRIRTTSAAAAKYHATEESARAAWENVTRYHNARGECAGYALERRNAENPFKWDAVESLT